jgi:hypothetical protein
VLSRILVALGLAAAVVSAAAVAFLRTDFVANNLCAYAVATIEEATAARVQVTRCSVQPEQGKLTIEGLRVGDPGGRIEVRIERVFAQVKVRPLLQRVRLERLEVDRPELRLALDQAGARPPSGGQCLPDVLDRFEFGRVKVRKASVEVRTATAHLSIPRAGLSLRGNGSRLSLSVSTRGGLLELPGRTVGLISSRSAGIVDLRGPGAVDLRRADVIGTDASIFVKEGAGPWKSDGANLRVEDQTALRMIPGVLRDVKGGIAADATVSLVRGRCVKATSGKNVALAGTRRRPASRSDLTPARPRWTASRYAGRGERLGGGGDGDPRCRSPRTSPCATWGRAFPQLGLPHVRRPPCQRAVQASTIALFQRRGHQLELADFAVGPDAEKAGKMLEFARGSQRRGLGGPGGIVASCRGGGGESRIGGSILFTDVQKDGPTTQRSIDRRSARPSGSVPPRRIACGAWPATAPSRSTAAPWRRLRTS